MAESKIRNGFSRTTLLTVGRLLLFIGAGFVIGLVLGVAAESPSLLAGHLRGDSQTIELGGTLAERVAASESASRATIARVEGGGAHRESDGEREASAAESSDEPFERVLEEDRVALPQVAAPPPAQDPVDGAPAIDSPDAGSWAIQVGAFGDEPSATRLVDQLESKGYPVAVLPAGADSNRWRVRVQPIAGESAARSTAERIEREERLPIWVIRLEGSARE